MLNEMKRIAGEIVRRFTPQNDRQVQPEIVGLDTRMRISNIGLLPDKCSLTIRQQVNQATMHQRAKYRERLKPGNRVSTERASSLRLKSCKML